MNAIHLLALAALALSMSSDAAVRVPVHAVDEARLLAPEHLDPLRRKSVVVDRTRQLAIEDLVSGERTAVALPGHVVGVVVNAVTGKAFAATTLPGSLVVVDMETASPEASTTLGNDATAIVADFPRGEVYVASGARPSLFVVQASTMKVLDTLALSASPVALAIDARRGLLYAASPEADRVDVVDLDYRQLAASVAVGVRPTSISIDEATGHVYVTNRGDATVSVIRPGEFAVVSTLPSSAASEGAAVSSVLGRVHVPGNRHLTVFDTRDHQPVAVVPRTGVVRKTQVSSDEQRVYAFEAGFPMVDELDAADGKLLRRIVAIGSANESAVISTVEERGETVLAIEYVDPSTTRYRHTADPVEARLIADGLHGDEWRRTMRFFRVWTAHAEGRVPVCRYSSTTNDAALFAFGHEQCARMSGSTGWHDHGIAYFVAQAGRGDRCHEGTVPLYRVSRLGEDGSTEYRHVVSAGVRDTMITRGWSVTDSGSGIVACVPRV